MSTFSLTGFFALGDGRRISAKTSRGATTYFNVYNTTIQCLDGVAIPAEMRIYSPPSNTPFPDNTIVHASAHAYIPPGAPALLDAVIMEAFHGDADDDSFMDSLPDILRVTAFGIGTVQSQTVDKSSTSHKSCMLQVSERVRDDKRETPLHCTFAGNPQRWENVPMPKIQSSVFFFGSCASLAPGGTLSINLEHITFNALAPTPTVGGGGPPSTPSPSKRRKLDFRASSHASPPSPSPLPVVAASSGSSQTPAVVRGTLVQTFPPSHTVDDQPADDSIASSAVPLPAPSLPGNARPKRKAAPS